jgi:tRNA A-37 threonylcarbamoyl transferase component Bud32
MQVEHDDHPQTLVLHRGDASMNTGPSIDALTVTESGDAHPGAGGLKSRIRGFLFGAHEPKQVGRFVIRRPLGSGGMGSVYLAHDARLERLVALKLVRYDQVSARTQERLRREAQALAKLAHPNVVPVFEVGEHDGLLFIAMEYVEGTSLREWLAAEPRSWSAIVSMFEQAAQGLAAAHQAGLIHRDFKPDNVLVGEDGRVRVVDFGLVATEHDQAPVADAIAAMSDASELLTDAPLTQTGELMGTPAYMAPEQFLGETPTPATDQFAFFVALYEALANERPFPGSSVPEMMRAVLAGDSRTLQLRSLPPQLRAAVERGIAREPKSRFPDMGAVLHTLARVRAPRRSRAPIWLGVAVLGLVGFGVVKSWEQAEAPVPSVAVVETGDGEAVIDEAAAAAIASLLASETDEQRIQLAQVYLSEHGQTGGVARQIIAEAAIGGALWRRSCPNARDLLCIELQADTPDPARCEERRFGSVKRLERNASDVSAALEHLRLVTRLASTVPAPSSIEELAALADAIGMATTFVADAELESALEIEAPRGLDFESGAEHSQLSKDALASYVERKTQELSRVMLGYRDVKPSGSDDWILVAAARTSLAYDNFADTMVTIPRPSTMTDEQERAAYCATLVAYAMPLREQAKAAFEYCKSRAAKTGLDAGICAPLRP